MARTFPADNPFLQGYDAHPTRGSAGFHGNWRGETR